MMARNLIVLPVELQGEFAHNLKTRGQKKNEPCLINMGLAAIRDCTDLGEAEDEIWKLNMEPAIGKKKYPPEDAFEGYFTEVREDVETIFSQYGSHG